MTEKQKKVLKLSIAFAVSFAIYPAANAMHIMEGVSPCGILYRMGHYLPAFSGKGLFQYQKTVSGEQKSHYHAGYGGRLHICTVRAENPVGDGKLLPYDGDRAGSYFIRAKHGEYTGNHCPFIPGNPSGPRRPDHPGGPIPFPWR